jgi:hypothetical protein
MSVGLDSFGKPLLQRMGLALQQYTRRLGLKAGCGTKRDVVTIDRCGTVTGRRGNFLNGDVPRANIKLAPSAPRHRTQGAVGAENFILDLRGSDVGMFGALLTLYNPTGTTSAGYCNEAAVLYLPYANFLVPVVQPSEYLGAFFLLPRLASEGPMCLKTPKAPEKAHEAQPIAHALPRGVNPDQLSQESLLNSPLMPRADPGKTPSEASRLIRGGPPGRIRRVSVDARPADLQQGVGGSVGLGDHRGHEVGCGAQGSLLLCLRST